MYLGHCPQDRENKLACLYYQGGCLQHLDFKSILYVALEIGALVLIEILILSETL